MLWITIITTIITIVISLLILSTHIAASRTMEIRTTHKMRQDLRQVDMVPHKVPFMEAARATDRVQVTEVPGATDRVQVTEVPRAMDRVQVTQTHRI